MTFSSSSSPVHFLSSPRDGLPPLADSPHAVDNAAMALANGTGPICVDTERASGFRFDDRAWLVQLRRRGAGTHVIDPAAVPTAGRMLAPLMNRTPWVLHAAHTDLPALTSLGWHTPQLHDTQIAGRLLGMGQVGLATMLEVLLGVTVAKDKGREDWSIRPLPSDLLNYAALDVEMLPELLDTALLRLGERADVEGRHWLSWYRQECDYICRAWTRPVHIADWTELRGIKAVRNPRGLELARRLTTIRTTLARECDIPPEKVIRASMIVDMAKDPARAIEVLKGHKIAPSTARKLTSVSGRSRDIQAQFLHAIDETMAVETDALPHPSRISPGRPDYRTWPSEYPVAARLLAEFRDNIDACANDLGLQPSELLPSRSVRSLAWETSKVVSTGLSTAALDDPVAELEETIGEILVAEGSRNWQIDLIIPACVPALATEYSR